VYEESQFSLKKPMIDFTEQQPFLFLSTFLRSAVNHSQSDGQCRKLCGIVNYETRA